MQSGALAIEEAWKNLRKRGKTDGNMLIYLDLLKESVFFYHCGSHPFGEVVVFAVPAIIMATKRVTQMQIIMEDASRDFELNHRAGTAGVVHWCFKIVLEPPNGSTTSLDACYMSKYHPEN